MISTRDLNARLLQAEYAVRGPIVQRAQELEREGRRIIYCNIGNPQALRQPPLSYLRQVLALVEYPALLDDTAALRLFKPDLVERARHILAQHAPGTGAYTQSPGIPFIREAVAEFIRRRDGIPASWDSVILTDGASKGAQAVLTALLREPTDGFLIPIPQYPLYSATLTLLGGRQIGYFIDEPNRWQLGEKNLVDAVEGALREGTHPVGLVVINPGNPTGAVLTHDNIQRIVGFARRYQLAIVADEVYQDNVYAAGCAFHSFARVMHELGDRETPLFSLHSVSKGFLGECGHRGGYLELRNLPPEVMAQFIKLQSISLCANVPGQLATYLMVAPPQPADASYPDYQRERDAILLDLKTKAEILGCGVNQIAGMSVDIPQGAMYAFVRFELPAASSARVAATTPEERARVLDRLEAEYCLALLEQTGICVVPGSGFGQLQGTLHFRTTFLPPADQIQDLVASLKTFHEHWVAAQARHA